MKRNKTKWMGLLLGSAITLAALGGGLSVGATARADDSPIKIAPSSIWKVGSSSTATVAADATTTTATALTLQDGGKVSLKRDVALKWFTAEGAVGRFHLSLSLKDKNFKSIELCFESAVANAVKDDKATNKIVFSKDSDDVVVKVNDGAQATVSADVDLVLSDESETELGTFAVLIGGTKVGTFTNIGANYFDYNSSSMTPLTITAETEEEQSTVIWINELNGQSFTLDGDGKLTDDAKPVLVVNEDLMGFPIGKEFSLAYEVIDVVDTSVTKKINYYQYNPNDTEANYDKTLSTSSVFMDTTYTKADTSKSTVYKEEGKEYVSVRFTLEDDSHTGDNATVSYLEWYVGDFAVSPTEATKTQENTAVSEKKYVAIEKDEIGPKYAWNDAACAEYENGRLKDKAEETTAASGNYFYLPSLKGMFDETAYTTLKITLYYKSQGATSPSSRSDLSTSNLSFPVSKAGWYEFKVSAKDKAGNACTVNVGGDDTIVNSDNVWDLDEVYTFKVYIKGETLSVKDEAESDRKDTALIDAEYTVKTFTVNGLSDYNSAYALYFFDVQMFKQKYPNVYMSESVLSGVSYSALTANVDPANVSDYKEYCAELYANALAANVSGITAEALLEKNAKGFSILRQIEEYNGNYGKDVYPDNVYKWDATTRKFKAVEEGDYLVFGVFTDKELFGEVLVGYKVIHVSTTEDVIKGESDWLKKNLASVILFSIAGVMLVAMVVLFFIKPSDETLDDLDKDEKKAKKAKKEKTDENE